MGGWTLEAGVDLKGVKMDTLKNAGRLGVAKTSNPGERNEEPSVNSHM